MATLAPNVEEFRRLVRERREGSPEDDVWAALRESTPMWCEACGLVDRAFAFAAFMGEWQFQCPSCGATGMLLWPWDSAERPGPRLPIVPEPGHVY